MQIRLGINGPAFWFLGDPKKLSVFLSLDSMGPVDVDINTLTVQERYKLLNSLNNKEIETDDDYKTLFNKPYIEPVKEDIKDEVLSKQNNILEKALKAKGKAEKRRNELLDKQEARCKLFLKSSLLAIRTSVKDETDLSFLRAILKAEIAHRNRKSVINYLNKKIIFLSTEKQRKVEAKVRRETAKQLRMIQKETSMFNVIESDIEVVSLSTEDLIHYAM